MPYSDLHAHVLALAEAGKLRVIDEPVNKDTEIIQADEFPLP
jgi:3-polyprenyl-4-hydroxybenzoate decarboxylase